MNLPDFSKARVLIVGDVMLDQYWHGNTQRISPEAPVPIVHIKNNEQRAGGASNVALNIASLGASVCLLGLTGDDINASELEAIMAKAGVDCRFQRCPGLDTIFKLRVVAHHQQMIRLDFEDSFAKVEKQELLKQYGAMLADVDVVVLSDYNKGTLSDVGQLISLAKTAGKPVIVDPKGSDFEKYRGSTLITPNKSEFEAVAGYFADNDELIKKGDVLRNSLDLQALLVTRGEDGMSLLQEDLPALHLPTYAQEVFDVTGAGDTVVATLAATLAAGASLEDSVTLANYAAGVVVGKLGTATVSPLEIYDAHHDVSATKNGVVTEDWLVERVAMARQRGLKVVMTNGCFDILHAGHVAYLQRARQLGDYLVIGVNSDESVRQLKGETRPVNGLEQRMILLAALGCVDWVVPFVEETPDRLYSKVLPTILVKGGDYTPEEVVGGEDVIANGGEVVILDFLDGLSTSNIIKKIQG